MSTPCKFAMNIIKLAVRVQIKGIWIMSGYCGSYTCKEGSITNAHVVGSDMHGTKTSLEFGFVPSLKSGLPIAIQSTHLCLGASYKQMHSRLL